MFVNYDMVFAVMLLSEEEGAPAMSYGRCVASPFRKKCYVRGLASMDVTADATMILAWQKANDDYEDETGFKRVKAGILRMLLKPYYKRAAKRNPELAFETERYLSLFSKLEKEGCTSIDRMLDCMGRYAETMANQATRDREAKMAILNYETRLITLADALDDYEEDKKAGRYNLISTRYGTLDENTKKEIRLLITHMMNEQYRLFKTIQPNVYGGIVENILTRGADQVMNRLLSGEPGGKRGNHHA